MDAPGLAVGDPVTGNLERRMDRMRAKPLTPPLSRGVALNDRTALATVAAVLVGVSAVLLWRLPAGQVLPAVSILLVVCAALTALLAFLIGSERSARGFTAWDAAGVFVFIGCCAAMLSEPAHILALLEGQFAHQADPFPRDPPL
jgi:hypothetical protein